MALVVSGRIVAQSDPAKAPLIWTGVFSDAQAERGKAVLSARCASCHGRNQPLSGDGFMLHWEGHDVGRLFQKIRDTMPPRSVAVPEQEKLDAVAYILQENGYPSGTKDLSVDVAVLTTI